MIARAPRFWTTGGPLALLAAPIAAIWGAVAARRMAAPPRAVAPMPVIVVGNYTAGGAGKTPTVLALVPLLRAAGFTPAILSRGWGGSDTGPRLVDPACDDASRVGDEPLLEAAIAPTVVSRDRIAGLATVAATGADLLILDDGFQNPALARDLRLVVVDAGVGIGNGRVIPAGPLRAPLGVQLAATDLILLVASDEPPAASVAPLRAAAAARGVPVLGARLVARAPEDVAGRRVLAYAGIGRPEKFAAGLAAAGATVVDLVAFADHRPLDEADAARLLARCAVGNLVPVTTEKDAARARGTQGDARARLAAASVVFAVDLVVDDPAALVAAIVAAVARRRGA
ncbi:tetraacyldisaccharide 4'-kinase [Siculibacillus lacustris]|uniref:Tetraacyldisaccharide 4'-kinase n=1 Tax=Siculibacillus lacustris TaxID=1549641 RepID=A0A4Q9VIX8_9HYPH|nr:tetraacyldisaccharide 4'-kinase [Siculibacillus lacustris]TBW34980.1 tetraacyldisaccharide 4'-kinase [Siculibacillus lacustris]